MFGKDDVFVNPFHCKNNKTLLFEVGRVDNIKVNIYSNIYKNLELSLFDGVCDCCVGCTLVVLRLRAVEFRLHRETYLRIK